MARILVAWIGRTDIRASEGHADAGTGPIAQALTERSFDEVLLLADYPAAQVDPYRGWLQKRTKAPISVRPEKLSGPTQFGEIYQAAVRSIDELLRAHSSVPQLTFHLSPGTPAMAAIWIILSKTRFSAELIESSKDHGVKTVSVPFDISAEFLPDLLREHDERLKQGSAGDAPEAPEFADIKHRSKGMERLVQRARRVALRSIPVLLEGESGTGKEMFARAIHRASPRAAHPLIAVNCGAIPHELIESELFGHEKGAFTGATSQRIGLFESAHRGTLFLDEVGELPAPAQVKLLRTLQEGEVVRLGSSTSIRVDVRIVAATNRTLLDEVSAGRFREDLFYRLAVAVLKIPALRERAGDLGLLVDHLLAQVNREAASEPGFRDKKLSASARTLLLAHPWPGNVRELLNTLRRAAVWTDTATISAEDVRDALLPARSGTRRDPLSHSIGGGFNLSELLGEVARSYLGRAMDEAQGNKTKAAELLGLGSYQTLTNWLSKYKVAR